MDELANREGTIELFEPNDDEEVEDEDGFGGLFFRSNMCVSSKDMSEGLL